MIKPHHPPHPHQHKGFIHVITCTHTNIGAYTKTNTHSPVKVTTCTSNPPLYEGSCRYAVMSSAHWLTRVHCRSFRPQWCCYDLGTFYSFLNKYRVPCQVFILPSGVVRRGKRLKKEAGSGLSGCWGQSPIQRRSGSNEWTAPFLTTAATGD